MPTIVMPFAPAHSEPALRAPAGVALQRVETHWFKARDGFDLNFKRLPPVKDTPDRGAVIMVHGSGVRANLFCPPSTITLPAMLSAQGFDVWILNWRASIDLEASEYVFDDAALHDFPAAVEYILNATTSKHKETLKAVIHCQGSHAFMMSITAGLLPEVTRVVANSTGMHPDVRFPTRIKFPLALASVGRVTEYWNPQWGLYAPSFWSKVIDYAVRALHHECQNAVCKHSSFTFGTGRPLMWSHQNLDEATHDWIKGEFAHVPVSLFSQTWASIRQGNLVRARPPGVWPNLPVDYEFGVDPPRDGCNAKFLFTSGADNLTFRKEGIKKTYDYFQTSPTAGHAYWEFPGYGHLDIFFGQFASRDVFPVMIDWLEQG